MNNRLGILTSDVATVETGEQMKWNMELMRTVIPQAYCSLLLALKALAENNLLQNYYFYKLWPLKEKLKQYNPWVSMIKPLYTLVATHELFYSITLKKWLYMNSGQFLSAIILCYMPEHTSAPNCVFEVAKHLDLPIIDLPTPYHVNFNLEKVTLTEPTFVDLFFKNIPILQSSWTTFCQVIQCMLEVYVATCDDDANRSQIFSEYFLEYPSIPCKDGKILRKCTEVVDSKAEFADLFDSNENIFPLDTLSERNLTHLSLVKLGMISETIPYDMLVERARTVIHLYRSDQTKALKRVQLILSLSTQKTKKTRAGSTELLSVPFLPVLQKPLGYYYQWKGEGYNFMCGEALVIADSKRLNTKQDNINSDLAGSQVAFLNEEDIDDGGCGSIDQEAIQLLKIRTSPSLQEVIAHYNVVQRDYQSLPHSHELVVVTSRICHRVYEYLDDLLNPDFESTESISSTFIEQIPSVWTGKEFVDVSVIAFEWDLEGPYLYQLPPVLSSYKYFLEALKIKQHFFLEDIDKALQKMKQDFGNKPIDDNCKQTLAKIVHLLLEIDLTNLQKCSLLLPDEDYILRDLDSLTFHDTPWARKDSEYKYSIDSIVPEDLRKLLGIKATSSRILKTFTLTEQCWLSLKERLIERIKGLLISHPFGITVFKELLQNADNAKATKMYFILDKRTHGSQSIISQNWEKLQGPALLVWNDSVFSEKDFESIQKFGLGGKHSGSETIGQFGIGFNVVYHLTDCPSFITGEDTLCVLDPHCKYAPGASEFSPGRRYDNLSSGFWECFSDMASAFLQHGLDNCPPELNGGSLFRFPLRHTREHMRRSKLVQRNSYGEPVDDPVSSAYMHSILSQWASVMKEALLFLSFVSEIQFMVIEENCREISIISKCVSKVDESAQRTYSRETLYKAVSDFKNKKGNKSVVVMYPLTVYDVHFTSAGKETTTEENWLIQQGVGDIDNEQQTWNFIDIIKPNHGIAVPVPTQGLKNTDSEGFSGKVFNLLPLPISLKLPVHLNGNFILDSSHRCLWTSGDDADLDSKSTWNAQLMEALASSYVNLLEHAQSIYVSSKSYSTPPHSAISQYYDIFPQPEFLEGMFKQLADSVYKKLVLRNIGILAVIDSEDFNTMTDSAGHYQTSKTSSNTVVWYPPRSSASSTQPHLLSLSSEWSEIKTILDGIGMKLTIASCHIVKYLNESIENPENTIKDTSPESVFVYYSNFSSHASISGEFPCAIEDTVFKNVALLRKFTLFLSKVSDTSDLITKEVAFPKEPFGCPLLLTADDQLRRFERNAKVLKSSYSHLFPLCLEHFLHPDLLELSYSTDYFLDYTSISDNAYSKSLANQLFSKQLPSFLRSRRVNQFHSKLSRDKLAAYWSCFCENPVFYSNFTELLKNWALLPSTLGSLHSYTDTLVPIVPPVEYTEDHTEIYGLLQKIGVPFLDTVIVDSTHLTCSSIGDVKTTLRMLHHLSQERDICLTLQERHTLILYLKEHEFQQDLENLRYVKSLPLFECIDGSFTLLTGKVVYFCPSDASRIGYLEWIRPNVVFLKQDSLWIKSETFEDLGITTLSVEELYSKFVFKAFSSLSESERYEHLSFINENIFATNILYSKSQFDNDNKRNAISFIGDLKMLECISDGTEVCLRPVADYCHHKMEIFTTFKEYFNFMPEFFRHSWSDWVEFFSELGLKMTVTKDEFLKLCQQIANGGHKEPINASNVLMTYLLSDAVIEAEWHTDESFLKQVASVPFVPTHDLPELSWIHSAKQGSIEQIIDGQRFSLNKLNGAAFRDCAVHLWTVKPIVQLPAKWQPLVLSNHQQLAKKMGIAYEASVGDVLQNIQNICILNRFTSSELFTQYPSSNKPPTTPEAKTLMTVMINHFSFLQSRQNLINKEEILILKDTPCIPVHSKCDENHDWQTVLVKPYTVLNSETDKEFYPYLHETAFTMYTFAAGNWS